MDDIRRETLHQLGGSSNSEASIEFPGSCELKSQAHICRAARIKSCRVMKFSLPEFMKSGYLDVIFAV